MTGRERLTCIVNREPADRLAWTTLADSLTRSQMPDEFRETTVIEFYRAVGCDILQFGSYGLPESHQLVPPCRLVTPDTETESHTEADGTLVRTLKTQWGNLISSFRNGHPLKHPVGTADELRILKNVWADSRYEGQPGHAESWDRVNEVIGDAGIYCQTFGPSPVQQLLEYDMGVENFYCLLQDCEGEMAELLSIMHHCRRQEYEIWAREMRPDVAIPVENTSSAMVSPSVYERHSLPQIRDFVDIMHRHGKKAILHMCGHLKALLPVIKETGLDGINGLTPPPVGDTPYDMALDVLGDDLIILGGVFDPSIAHAPSVTKQDIRDALDRMYTPRIHATNFLLWFGVDGLPTPVEKFLWFRDWFSGSDA